MAVPLFIMLSGALLLGKKESAVTFYTKRLGRVGIPWFFWGTVGLLGQWYQQALVDQKSLTTLFQDPVGVGYHAYITSYWYLALMAVVYCFTPWLRWLIRTLPTRWLWLLPMIFFSGGWLLTFIIETKNLPQYIQLGWLAAYFGYFLAGYLMRQHQSSPHHPQWQQLTVYGVIFGWLITAAATDLLSQQHHGFFGLFYHYSFITVICQSLATFWLFLTHWPRVEKWIHAIKNGPYLLDQTSKFSYGIFLLQFWVISWIQDSAWLTALQPLVAIPLVSVIAFSICFSCAFVLSRQRLFKRVV